MTLPEETQLAESLDRLLRLHEAARQSVDPNWHSDLRTPASETDLSRAESVLGRLLSEETLQLYRWHDGAGAREFVPLIGFNSLDLALRFHDVTRRFGQYDVTNDRRKVDMADLFPIFSRDRLTFGVLTSMDRRAETSPLFTLDPEPRQLTMQAYTLGAFIDHLIDLFTRRRYESAQSGLRWLDAPYVTQPDMKPFGPVV